MKENKSKMILASVAGHHSEITVITRCDSNVYYLSAYLISTVFRYLSTGNNISDINKECHNYDC